MKIILAGGSGFLGRALGERFLAGDHEIVVLGRGLGLPNDFPAARFVAWDAKSRGSWEIELDGAAAEVTALFGLVEQVCTDAGACEIQVARTEEQRARFWMGRKAAFAAMGRVSPSYYVQDAVIPRTKLPEVLGRIRSLETESGLKIGNVFHAGDGNLHPLVCYDDRIDGQADLAQQVASEILTFCLEAGGSITGEHGVGADKADQMPKMFSETDLDTMQRVRCAFDPKNLCNPGKIFPTPRLCGEVPGPYRVHPVEAAGLADRM